MKRIAACQCEAVALEVSGQPILSAICHCDSCQTAGEQLEKRDGAPPVLGAHRGTSFMLVRKDRIGCLRGEEHLAEARLKPTSPTRRVVATCCNSPMFLEFTNGHWLSLYMDRFDPADRAQPELRTMTKDLRVPIEDDEGVPAFASHSGRFMWRLLKAWAAMGFRSPKINYVKGHLP
ncbi:MAG: hypothetical protein MEQ84_04125 [Mesorhizobium sp.]|nr:hypothetical protein [Mesorhizobium sp.]